MQNSFWIEMWILCVELWRVNDNPSFYRHHTVPGPPYILSDRQYTDLIDVDFAEPCEQNGEILGYRVQYQEFGQRFSNPIQYPASQRRIRVTGLRQQTRYILELSAKTSLGFGQKATIEFYTKGSPGIYWFRYF